MVEEHPYLLTIVVAVHAASIRRPLQSKSAVAAAAATPHASLPFVLLNLRMGVLAPLKTRCMTVTKVRPPICLVVLVVCFYLTSLCYISFCFVFCPWCEQRLLIIVFACLHIFPLVHAISQTSSIIVRRAQQALNSL